MLELLFRGFFEWIHGLILECWEYFSSVLFDLMSLDFAYLETYMPIITTIRQIMLGVGWALASRPTTPSCCSPAPLSFLSYWWSVRKSATSA